MRLERLHISVFLSLAALAWWLVLVAQGTPANGDHLRPFSTVVGVLVILTLAFERLLWRQWWLHGWFTLCTRLEDAERAFVNGTIGQAIGCVIGAALPA